MAADEELIKMLRRSGKLFWLLANKCDSTKQEMGIVDFSKLGLDEDEVFPISAEHDLGFDELRTNLQMILHDLEANQGDLLISSVVPQFPLVGSLAIIGAPNVEGKSTLLNQLLGMERSIVSPVAGTTVDPVEAYLTLDMGESSQRSG